MNEYWEYRIASLLARGLPRSLAYWFGLRLADRFYTNHHADREAVASNLRRILRARGITPSEDKLQAVARKTFQYFGKYLVDFFRYSRLSQKDMDRLVSVEHPEYLQECLAAGRGVLVLTAHLGNWELAGAVMDALGHPVHAVVLPERLRKVDEMFQRRRERRGMQTIPLGRAASGILRCLRNNEVVGLLADRDFTARDDRVPFFGKPARLPLGPALLSRRSGAPVLPCFLLREVDDRFLFRFHAPLWPERMAGVEALHEAIRRLLEQEIGENPHQWFIFDDFWADGDRAQAQQVLKSREDIANGRAENP